MRPAILCCFLAILTSCSRSDDRTARTSGEDAGSTVGAEPTTSPKISLADFAGTWKTRATDETGAVMGEAVLLAKADTSGWTLTFPKQKPIPVRVIAVAGDSIVTEAGPYASSRIKGAQIRTRAVNRLRDGKLVATIEGRYTIAGRDSVFHLRAEGTREP
jgi:hypothetical protein